MHNCDEVELRIKAAAAEGIVYVVVDRVTDVKQSLENLSVDGIKQSLEKTLGNALEILSNPRESAEKSVEALKSIKDKAVFIVEHREEIAKAYGDNAVESAHKFLNSTPITWPTLPRVLA